MLKLSDNPPILYPLDVELADIPGPWWVAHTKARNEKALAQQLAQWSIAYFLPLREKLVVKRGRRLTSMLPLFSGYLFFAGDDEARYHALTSNRIAQVIAVVDQDKLCRELAAICRALQARAPLDPHPYLKVGARCRVRSGALAGIEGLLERKQNVTRLLLQVDILGQAAAVEIDADLLEPVE